MRNRSFLTSPFTRTAKVCTPSASATSRNMGCPVTGGTPAMTCTFMPDIPSQENLGSGRAGSSAKLVSGAPAGNAVTTGADHDDGAPEGSNSIKADQNENG